MRVVFLATCAHAYVLSPLRPQTALNGAATAKMPEVPEALREPGLKVPATAWKWPRNWPFATDAFETADKDTVEAKEVFDETAKAELEKHLVTSLPSGAARVLLMNGAGAVEYIPKDGGEEMWAPPKEVEVIEPNGDLTKFDDEAFDAVVLTNAAELMRDPRTAFRNVWRILKFGGRCVCAFSSKASTESDVARMWKDYDDAQRIWVVGSFFHFSAGAPAAIMTENGIKSEVWGAGWRNLKGYDFFNTAEQSKKKMNFQNLLAGTAPMTPEEKDDPTKQVPLYVIQADKTVKYDAGAGPTAAMDAEFWAATSMEEDDKRLVATRILSFLNEIDDPAMKEKYALACAKALPAIYDIVQPMSRVIATPLLAQLAANLAPRWNMLSTQQPLALREGLGLDEPQPTFWKPLGTFTEKLTIDDKLWLLADLVPFFNERKYPRDDDDLLPVALDPFMVKVLPKTLNHIRSTLFPNKNIEFEGPDAQLLAVDIIARDYLPDAALKCKNVDDANAVADNFCAWVTSLTEADLKAALEERRAFRESAEKKFQLALLDPETAQKNAEDLRRAKRVEDMMNDIALRIDTEKKKKAGSGPGLPFSGL